MKDIFEKLITRRSIRNFVNYDTSKGAIDKIIEAGLSAPSSKNSNPWFFLVLKGSDKDLISRWTEEESKVIKNIPIDPKTGKQNDKWFDSTYESSQIIKKCSCLILVYNNSPYSGGIQVVVDAVRKENIEYLNAYTVELIGIGAAIENMLLAAHFLGLGGVCLRDLIVCQQKIKEYFRIEYDLIAGIAIGKPVVKSSKRKPTEGLVVYKI
jgi:nitroreductase